MILNPGTAGCPAVCYAEGRAASDANRGQAPRACHAPVPGQGRGRRLRDGHLHRLVRRDAIADVTHQYQRATAGDRTPGIPSLTRAEWRRSPGAVPD